MLSADATRAVAILSAAAQPPASLAAAAPAALPAADYFWRSGSPPRLLLPPRRAPPQPADAALAAPNPPLRPGSLAVPPPPEVMENTASSLVNCRIKLALLRNYVNPAQRALRGAAAAGSLLARLAAEPAFTEAADSVGLTAALLARALGRGGEEGGGGGGGGAEGDASALQVRASTPPTRIRHCRPSFLFCLVLPLSLPPPAAAV